MYKQVQTTYCTDLLTEEMCFERWFKRLQWYCQHKARRKAKPSIDLRAWGDILAWKQDIGRSHTPASTQFTICLNMWENLVAPFNIYCGGTSIIIRGPSGHSVTHPPGKWHSGFKWDKTFASGISISKPNMHTGPVWRCYVRLPPRPSPPKTGGKIKKRQWEGPRLTNRWELQFSSFLSPIKPYFNSTSRPIPEHSYSDGKRPVSSSSDPPTSSDKCQPPVVPPTPPPVAPHCTIYLWHMLVGASLLFSTF